MIATIYVLAFSLTSFVETISHSNQDTSTKTISTDLDKEGRINLKEYSFNLMYQITSVNL